jgi:hypothetical protein
MVVAGPEVPVFDYGTRWCDANDELTPQSAEDQRSRKNQSDHLLKHDTSLLVLGDKL